MKKKEFILVVDFGSQYTRLITNKIQKIGIEYELCLWNKIKITQNLEKKLKGIILSGGPNSVLDNKKPQINNCVFQANVPILGICYGMQIMISQLGGKVKKSKICEFGSAKLQVIKNSSIIDNVYDYKNSKGQNMLQVWMSHQDQVVEIPKGFSKIASTENCKFAIISNEKSNYYGIQFHPEVSHTSQGINIIKRFSINICKCKPNTKKINIIKNIINYIKNKVQDNEVILGLSGGIDSSVTAILLQKAIGNKLICFFIDNGLLHTKNTLKIIELLKKKYNINVISLYEKKRFFKALLGIQDPEKKRQVIGNTFIKIFHEQSLKLKSKIKWLAQGTICADLIESSYFNNVSNIKSHHNVVGITKNIDFNLIEPIKNLFKDEVKKIGLELGLPYDLVFQYPFPGPGFGIRILGEIKENYCKIIKKADSILIEELHKNNIYHKISQAFSIFIPIKSVGIVGDNRKYKYIIVLRIIESKNFLTAKWFNIPYKILEKISSRLTNEINDISRVVYDISNKPPATIEWE